MPLAIQKSSRMLNISTIKTVFGRIGNKLTGDSWQTLIAVFGIMAIILDTFAYVAPDWYIGYILIIMGYFLNQWIPLFLKKETNLQEKKEEST